MKFKAVLIGGMALSASLYLGSANAGLIACQQISTTNNYMQVSDGYVSSCIDSGVGELTGIASTDAFLQVNSGWVGVDGGTAALLTKTSAQTTGSFSLDSNLWNSWDNLLIGFRFGTGNQPDEWFVYALNDLVSVGSWTFINVGQKGGGFTNAQIYGSGAKDLLTLTNVPEPGTISLLGAGLLVVAFARRFRKQSV